MQMWITRSTDSASNPTQNSRSFLPRPLGAAVMFGIAIPFTSYLEASQTDSKAEKEDITMYYNKRKIAIIALFATTVAIIIGLAINIAPATKAGVFDGLSNNSIDTIDNALHFSSATVVVSKTNNQATSTSPNAQIAITNQGDTVSISASNFAETGDEVTIELVVKNSSEYNAIVNVSLNKDKMQYFDISINWDDESQVVLANGGENKTLLKIKLVKQPIGEITEKFSITLQSITEQQQTTPSTKTMGFLGRSFTTQH